ncbi:endolytic transglycosylase MltG [Paenibacillus koleovorans]|uniref:endolytic transglycosylase MltG n=1 Tax=Paenibacillus koleovorans TaxID=121608 RepID=UPI000FDC6FDC|nr:endolytic transglycosylase MltG [Paenibacillus koleovorans]
MEQEEQQQPSRTRWKTVLWVVVILILLGIGTVAGVGLYAASSLEPVAATDEQVELTIEPGTGSAGIADQLETKGLIRDAFIFKVYLKYKGEGSRFQAGTYAIATGTTLDDIIAMLNAGDTVKAEMVRFTIPEGFTVLQIADKLASQGAVNRDVFLQTAEDKAMFVATHPWIAQIPDSASMKHRMEGYLFPETYEMKKGSTEKDIVERMLQELDRKLAGLPVDWKDKLQASGLTFHQMMTIASLVEREVAVDAERTLVAGVIHNRMKQSMKLQIDATVQYALDAPKDRLFEKDLLIEHPYNTYYVQGLPPGPIASPSLKSIQAALYPAETKYLYYVTKKDGTQAHYFAETYQQHLNNIDLSNKKR